MCTASTRCRPLRGRAPYMWRADLDSAHPRRRGDSGAVTLKGDPFSKVSGYLGLLAGIEAIIGTFFFMSI
jgi:hypothetical protein